jgi:hypothetical protein
MPPLFVAVVLSAFTAKKLHVCTTMDFGYNEWSQGNEVKTLTSSLFVGKEKDTVMGYDSQLREKLFPKLGFAFNLSVYPTYSTLVTATSRRECDVGFAPFVRSSERLSCDTTKSISDDNNCIEFALRYYTGGCGMFFSTDSFLKQQSTLKLIIQPDMMNKLFLLLLIIVVAGHIIWFIESRYNNADFAHDYRDGIDDGIWWALITVSTVGYGDKYPRSAPGRLFTCVLVLAGIVVYAVFAGTAAAALSTVPILPTTYSEFRTAGVKVCSLSFYNKNILKKLHSFPDRLLVAGEGNADSLLTCMEKLRRKEVQAVYYDLPFIGAYRLADDQAGFKLSEYAFAELEKFDYHVAFPSRNYHDDLPIDATTFSQAILEHMNEIEGQEKRIDRRYFEDIDIDYLAAIVPSYDWALILVVSVWCALYGTFQLFYTCQTYEDLTCKTRRDGHEDTNNKASHITRITTLD